DQGAWDDFEGGDLTPPPTLTQSAFRAFNDNGSETGATGLAAENTNFTAPLDTNLRLRMQLNAANDPTSKTFRLDYKKSGDSVYVPALVSAPGIPTFQDVAASSSGTGAVSPVWPAHQAGDIALLFVESCGGEAATLSTAAGFAAVANSPQATGTTTAGTQLTVFWCRATSAAMGAPTVADPGNHVYARIYTFRGCIAEGNPWNITGGGVKASASTSVSATGVTTTVPNCLIVIGVASDVDSASAFLSAQANASLGSLTERGDEGTIQGNGGAIAVTTGTLATAGASGTMTGTVVSSINAFLTIALRPQTAPIMMSASSNVTGGGEATTARLTAPSGKSSGSDFQTGRMWDDENGTDALDLTSDKYTELEWSIKALSANGAANAEVYQFRVTDVGTALNTYTYTPEWTIGTGGGGTTYYKTLPAIVIGVSAMSRRKTALKALARTMTGQTALAKLTTHKRTLAGILGGVSVLARRKTSLKAVPAVMVGGTAITRARATLRPMAAAMAGVSALTRVSTHVKALAAGMAGVVLLTRIKTLKRTLAAATHGVSVLSRRNTFKRTLPAVAVSVPVLSRRSTYSRALASAMAGIAVLSKFSAKARALTATMTGVPALSRHGVFSRRLSAIGALVPTLLRRATHLKTLAVTLIGVAAMSRGRAVFKSLSATALGGVAIITFQGRTRSLSATLSGTAALSRRLTLKRTLAALAGLQAVLSRRVTRFRLLGATGALVPGLSRARILFRGLAATMARSTAVATLKTKGAALAATIHGVPGFARRVTYRRTLAVLASLLPVVSRSKSLKRTLAAQGVLVGGLSRRRLFFKALAAALGGIPGLGTLKILGGDAAPERYRKTGAYAPSVRGGDGYAASSARGAGGYTHTLKVIGPYDD
ncbi:MAG: hypothetical protein ABIW76_17165, partial [Fibrobacteria bacterium]